MPKIIEVRGDILTTTCEALVSPVDATGAQGAGLAKAIARKWPHQCVWYGKRSNCDAGRVYCDLRFSARGRQINPGAAPLILFATTKAHYSQPSKLVWVELCCAELVGVVSEFGIRSIAIPALGCGFGQRGILPADAFGWSDVRPLIVAAAERMPCNRVEIYAPLEEPR